MRLFSDRVASVVRRRIKLAARDLKSFALERNIRGMKSTSKRILFTWLLLWIFSFLPDRMDYLKLRHDYLNRRLHLRRMLLPRKKRRKIRVEVQNIVFKK